MDVSEILRPQNARRVTPTILYDNKDISADLKPYIKSISYTDNMTGQADDLQISLADIDHLWSGTWMPELGAKLTVSWLLQNWPDEAPAETFTAGVFEVDDITCTFGPSQADIKAVSIPDDSTLRGVEHTRSWEKATLKKVAKDIADGAKIELAYEPDYEINYDRVEQSDESDLAFLGKLCRDAGLALKVYSGKLVIFDEAVYEQADPIAAISRTDTELSTGIKFSHKLRDTYKACHVKYQNSKTKQLIEYTYTAPDKQGGKTLQVKEEVANIAEAERLAKKRLREKNCDEVTASFSCMGNTKLVASAVVNVAGFGAFDGHYLITRVQHDVSASGYRCSVDLRRCLNGY